MFQATNLHRNLISDNILNSNHSILSCQAPALSHLFPEAGESSRLKVFCRRTDYSASHISRAVEDAEAHILNLNITDEVPFEGGITVELRISHRNATAAARSLERYGYTVAAAAEDDSSTEITRRRIDELMTLLNV